MLREYPIERNRDIGIIAHIDAGKTTVSERILFYTGVSHKIGEVHEGDTVLDWMEQERERGITITAAATNVFWIPTHIRDLSGKPAMENVSSPERPMRVVQIMPKDIKQHEYRINLIDTPGHIDFTVEVKRSLRVLDGAVVVFDGVAGVEPQSETNWHYADEYKVPRICFINKLDRLGASFERSLQSIRERLNPKAVPVNINMGLEDKFVGVIDLLRGKAVYFEGEHGEKVVVKEIPQEYQADYKKYHEQMLEMISSEDDALAEKFLAGKEITIDELKKVLRKKTLDSTINPVFCGSALKNKGVQLLLDGVIDYLPSPLDMPPIRGIEPKSNQEVMREAKDEAPFSALAFKIASDPFVGSLTFFRVYSGKLDRGSYVYNSTKGEKERIGRILRMHANQREEIGQVFSGEIAAAVGMKYTSTGDTLSDENSPIILEQIKFPEPVISIRIEPKTKADQEKMGLSLKRLSEEDPTFRVRSDEETGEVIISGMGELHLEIIVERMKREFKVEANVGRPQVAYKETIKKSAEAEGKYIRQSGGRGQYGHVFLRVEPLERGAGYEFVDAIRGGIIPQEYIPATQKGVKEAMDKGVLAGYPLRDMRVTLYDGSFHEVDSSEAAFKIAGSIALQESVKRAQAVLLEPIMKVEAVTPPQFMGDVSGDLNSRRGRIENISDRAMIKVIAAYVPLANMFGYATVLRSMTEGRASYTMEFSHYEEVPNNVAQEIIEGKKSAKK